MRALALISGSRSISKGRLFFNAELVVFVDVDLDEEGLVAKASVGVSQRS